MFSKVTLVQGSGGNRRAEKSGIGRRILCCKRRPWALLSAPASDWIKSYLDLRNAQLQGAAGAVKQQAGKRNAESKPSLPLKSYVGAYRDAWYGNITIDSASDKLTLRFDRTPLLTGELEHWQYDTFIVRWRERSLNADAYVTFSLKPDGSIDQMKMEAVSPLTDFSFDFQDLLFVPVKERGR